MWEIEWYCIDLFQNNVILWIEESSMTLNAILASRRTWWIPASVAHSKSRHHAPQAAKVIFHWNMFDISMNHTYGMTCISNTKYTCKATVVHKRQGISAQLARVSPFVPPVLLMLLEPKIKWCYETCRAVFHQRWASRWHLRHLTSRSHHCHRVVAHILAWEFYKCWGVFLCRLRKLDKVYSQPLNYGHIERRNWFSVLKKA